MKSIACLLSGVVLLVADTHETVGLTLIGLGLAAAFVDWVNAL